MKLRYALVPVAALTLALTTSSAALAGQRRGSRADSGRDDGGRDAPDRSSRGAGERAEPRDRGPERRDDAAPRAQGETRREDGRDRAVERADRDPQYRAERRDDGRRDRGDRRDDGWNRGNRRDDGWNRSNRRDDGWRDRGWDRGWDRGGYRYAPPRVIVPRRAPRHYYGPGGNFSAYFGWGSGYRFGNWYSGRVYGYVPPAAYGARLYYGDVRLHVRPRFANVYVDGYYAGIVDDFDGVFQRLTLSAGPHEIEIDAPGYEPQYYEVYVDPTRTVELHGDLYPVRPY